MAIALAPGDGIRRTELHERYGGRRQGGISPSGQTPNVFLITAPQGEKYGYLYDGQNADGFFHYTGEGQFGDQQMVQGNRAIRDHVAEGRELHLFSARGPQLTYLGQFRYRDHYSADAPEANDGPDRKVIVFRLKGAGALEPPPSRDPKRPPRKTVVKDVPVEQARTASTYVDGDREPYESRRREQPLVLAFTQWLNGQGHQTCRKYIQPKGEHAPLYCDLFDITTNTIFEAKGSVARASIRMAIGQLADYSRLIQPKPKRAVLVPEKPRPDLIDLLAGEGIDVYWPEQDDFALSES